MPPLPWLNLRTYLPILAFSLLLSACGGSSSPPPPPVAEVTLPFQLSISQIALTAQGEEGIALAPIVVTGNGVGGPAPAAVYLGSANLGAEIAHVAVENVGLNATFTIHLKPDLPAGEYRGTLQLLACRDEKCASPFAGSPMTLPYTVKIAPGLQVTPGALRFSALSGETKSARVGLRLPAGQTTYMAEPTAPWLAVSGLSAEEFTVTAKAMPPGQYQGAILLTVGQRTMSVTVDYTVTGDANTVSRIIPDQASFSFSTPVMGSASSALNVTLPSWSNALTATVEPVYGATDWLSVTRLGDRGLSVAVSAARLVPGTYQANIVLAAGPGAPPVSVPVTYTVGQGRLTVEGNTTLTVRADTAAAALASDIAIGAPNMAPQAYTASTTSTWLTLSPGAGTTGGTPLHISVRAQEVLKLANFRSHTAEVTISPAANVIAPVKFTVTLTKSLSEVHYVSPSTRLPGESGVYTLRGRGFDLVTNLVQSLNVTGAAPTQVTRVSDTELKVQLAGAAAGDVQFSIANAVGATTSMATLSVIPQGVFPYTALATPGAKGSLVFDARRQALYTANKADKTVMRFAWNGSAWSTASAPLPNADSLALSPDGASLVATSAPRSIVLFDPLTLSQQASYDTVSVMADERNGKERLAVTNSGRAYFRGSNGGNGLAYLDLLPRTFGTEPIKGYYSFYEAPYFSVSGDGSRVNIVQSPFPQSASTMLYMDSGNDMVLNNPSSVATWETAAQSLRGERFVEGTGKVWDRDFALVGNLVLPDANYVGRTPVVSPDGARVYIMAYHNDIGYGGSQLPRVYVFDSRTRMTAGASLPLLGQFDLADFPTCRVIASSCTMRALGTISPDGKTLFLIGDANLVVAPIPALTPGPSGVGMQAAKSAGSGMPTLTRVPLRH